MADCISAMEEMRSRGGIEYIQSRFHQAQTEHRVLFSAYIPAGFPTLQSTTALLLALQDGGAELIELGIPFSDPVADGPVIQRANAQAIANGAKVKTCLSSVLDARAKGLKSAVVLMGYWNSLLAYGVEKICVEAEEVGVNGFLVVDLPVEEAASPLPAYFLQSPKPDAARPSFLQLCDAKKLSLIPLVAPTTSIARSNSIANAASSFIYCLSLSGTTGALTTEEWKKRSEEGIAKISEVVAHAEAFKQRRPYLLLGFGISRSEQVKLIANLPDVDGFVVGSGLVEAILASAENDRAATGECSVEAAAAKVRLYCANLCGPNFSHTKWPSTSQRSPSEARLTGSLPERTSQENTKWFWGSFGGRFLPETLMEAHETLAVQFEGCRNDPSFIQELDRYRRQYIGGPTAIHFAARLTEKFGGAQIYFKREELAFTGAHKINNAVGQALLAKRLGKTRVIAETGAGQHGVATATACALLGLPCTVYMGAKDAERQRLNVFRMKVLGAEVISVEDGRKTLKDAVTAALRDWVTNNKETHYLIGSAIGGHPFPEIVKYFQSVIGREARAQMLREHPYEEAGGPECLPDFVIACVGGGSNAIGIFSGFVNDRAVRLIGVESGGSHGVLSATKEEVNPAGDTPLDHTEPHCATLSSGRPGVFHGSRTYILQDADGCISETSSISAGLDYPGVGPELAALKESGRAEFAWVSDQEALDAVHLCATTEGIIPALEPAHAIAYAAKIAKTMSPKEILLINLCGRGDKDMHTIAQACGVKL